jgi:glutaredoxin
MEEITIYGTSWCVDCRRAKKFLEERGVDFS